MKKLLCIPLILLLVLPLVTEADDVDELYKAAIALIRAESYAAALTLLESAVIEQPNSPQIHFALGFAREKQGVESDAISSYLMAVKIALQLRLKDKKITKQESRGAVNAFQALDRLTPGRTAVLRKARDLAKQGLDMHGTDRRIVNEAVRKLRSIAFETETPISGHHVRVEMPGGATYMSLAEVQVFRNGTNIALAGTATQSSTYDKHQHGPDYAGKAIDNNTSGDILADGSVSHTRKDRSPWWEVDLGATYPIETITVWGRQDKHLIQSSNLKVSVLDARRKNVWSSNTFNAAPNATFNLKPKKAQK